MAEVKKIATRDSYGNTLKELAAEGHDDLVVLDADLAAATKTGMFRKAHPDRHFDCGIAEGNMMGHSVTISLTQPTTFHAGRAKPMKPKSRRRIRKRPIVCSPDATSYSATAPNSRRGASNTCRKPVRSSPRPRTSPCLTCSCP